MVCVVPAFLMSLDVLNCCGVILGTFINAFHRHCYKIYQGEKSDTALTSCQRPSNYAD